MSPCGRCGPFGLLHVPTSVLYLVFYYGRRECCRLCWARAVAEGGPGVVLIEGGVERWARPVGFDDRARAFCVFVRAEQQRQMLSAVGS